MQTYPRQPPRMPVGSAAGRPLQRSEWNAGGSRGFPQPTVPAGGGGVTPDLSGQQLALVHAQYAHEQQGEREVPALFAGAARAQHGGAGMLPQQQVPPRAPAAASAVGGVGPAARRTVYVTGIDTNLPPGQFERFLHRHGTVRRRRLCGDPTRDTQFGFFEFSTEQEAASLLQCDGWPVGSTTIRCHPAKHEIRIDQPEAPAIPRSQVHTGGVRGGGAGGGGNGIPLHLSQKLRQVMCTVHLAGIDPGADDAAVDEFLASHGAVVRRRVCHGDAAKPQKFGFFEFENPRQAQSCIAANGALLGGKPVRCAQAQKPIFLTAKEGVSATTVHVTGIDTTLPHGEADAFLAQCGKVVKKRMCGDATRPTQFGFVEFETEEEAQRLVSQDGTTLGKAPIRCSWARMSIDQALRGHCALDPALPCTVHIAGIDATLPDGAFDEFLARHGTIVRRKLCGDGVRPTQYGFFEFAVAEEAAACLDADQTILGQCTLHIQRARQSIRAADSTPGGALSRAAEQVGAAHAAAPLAAPPPAKSDAVERTVHVTNIDPGVTPEAVEACVQRAGEVLKRRMCGPATRGGLHAFFEFSTREAAQAMVQRNGTTLGALPIHCEPSKAAIREAN